MLTPKKALFVVAYIATQNATRAAITAGYSEKTAKQQGSRLLTDVDVKAALENAHATAIQRVQEATESAAASAQWIVEKAVDVVERAMTPLPVYYKGEPTAEMQFSGGVAVSALTLLSRMHAEFSEKHDIKAEVDLVERKYVGVRVELA